MNIKTGAFAPKTSPKNASTGRPVQVGFFGSGFKAETKPTCRGVSGFDVLHALTKIPDRIPPLFPLRGGGGRGYLGIKREFNYP